MDDFDFDWDEFIGGVTSGLDRSGGDTSWIDQFDWGSALDSLDFSGLDTTRFAENISWDDWLGQEIAPSSSQVIVTPEGDTVFTNPDGTKVTYDANGVVRTEDPGGRNVFYHTTDGKDYVVDYSSLKPGELVETFARDTGGEGATRYGAYHTTDGKDYYVENQDVYTPGSPYDTFSRDAGATGPTRYTQYSGTDGNAKVVDYSDVYGPGGGKVTTTTQDGDKTRTVTYEDNKVKDSDDSVVKKLIDAVGGNKNAALIAALLGGLAGLKGGSGGGGGGVGYQGTIPKYTATRGPSRSPTAGGRRPGAAGIGSLTGGVTYTPVGAAGGGLMGLAEGGEARPARYLAGGTDGMADKIQTDIDGQQPARLSHGEFVIPADVVSHLGNGNSDAGANVLYDMMAKVRKARTGTAKQGKQINPNKFVPGKGR